MNPILLLSEQQLKTLTPLSENLMVNSSLLPSIREAQEAWIKPLLGTALYDELQTLLATPPLTPEYQTLVEQIRPCLAWYALYQLLPFHWVKVREIGLAKQNEQHLSVVDLDALTYLRGEALASAERAAINLRRFLTEHAQTFPLYEACNACEANNASLNAYFSYV